MKRNLQSLLEGKKVIGIGTGRTVERYIKKLDKDAVYIPSSIRTMLMLTRAGLTVSNPTLYSTIDLYIDGADHFDREGNLIKGKGGAMTAEKLLCSMAKDVFIIVQKHKYRETLRGCSVPVEVIPMSLTKFTSILRQHRLGYRLRENYGKIGPVITDLGNCIIDVEYDKEFFSSCKDICGVVEHGFFEVGDFNVVIETFEEP